MQISLENIIKRGEKIAVALSGGCDSMSLLHFLRANAQKLGVEVLAINVEHGIRGESSIADTNFVIDYCKNNNVELLTYSVDVIKKAKEQKLSTEQAARILRYECFKNALDLNTCDKIATAHHRDDNVESVLFNIFRGTGLKGLTGIEKKREDKIIRPFLSLDRADIERYAKENRIPFVTDQTNLSDDYTRNYIRLNIIPEIKKIFPELNDSVERLSNIAKLDDQFINSIATKSLSFFGDRVELALPCHYSVLSRAVIMALKHLGITKDWEKAHIDQVSNLAELQNGAKLNLPKDVIVIKEYDKLVFYKNRKFQQEQLGFALGVCDILNRQIQIKTINKENLNLKSGLYADLNKIPKTAVIRTRKEGDIFTKFGGGSKPLGDYFTDIKLPLRLRDQQILIADGNQVLAIFGVAISDKIKIDENSTRIISLEIL